MTCDQEIKHELSLAVRLEYLAEGGANVVYRIILSLRDKNASQEIPPSEIPHYGRATPPPTEIEDMDSDLGDQIIETEILDNKLLRLRKNVRSGRPYREIAHEFHTSIRPLFGACELVDQTLIRVPRSIIQRCNRQLRESERLNVRPSFRRGVYLAEDEPLGMLVTDMTMKNGIHSVSRGNATENASGHIIELKPKWLLQSPSAPATARRCRTCALRDMKRTDSSLGLLDSNNKKKKTSTFQTGIVVPPEKANFCPLDLTSKDPKDLQHTIKRIFLSMPDQQVNIISTALYQHPILQKLLSLQRIHNKVGLDGPSPFGKSEISSSMTLRDCSIFVKISSSVHSNSHSQSHSHFLDKNGPEIDIRLGDLDLKSSGNGKAEYWLSIEKRLIEEGWYLGSQASQSLTEGECALSR